MNPLRTLAFSAALLAGAASWLHGQTQPTPRAETPQRTQHMAWWRQAHFGMFIHWGLYAAPAGEWKGQPVAGIGEWIMHNAKIPVPEYEKLASTFNPTKFDAEAWAQLAQDAGMKYVVITSKHHDGFSMFGSQATKYNIVDATPFKRDPMKELSAACSKRGIKFGFYYSHAQDWHEPGGMGNDWDFPSNDEKDKNGAFDKYLQEKAEPQVAELVHNYGPLGLIWFDTPFHMTAERAARFEKIVHDGQADCLVSGRIGPGASSDYDEMGDNSIPKTVRAGDWETPATLNDTWGFKKDDTHWKSPDDLIFKLVDITSKGGNYLLNVGPTAEGVIPQASQDILHEVGKWMKTNNESIYGCRPSPFGAEFGVQTTELDARGRKVFQQYKDWRCTTKPGRLYLHLFKPDMKQLEIPFTGKALGAYLLADAQRGKLMVSQDNGKTTIDLPADMQRDAHDTVVVVEVEHSAAPQ